MSIDYPRAWQIARNVPIEQHHCKCSFRVTNGALLCDCKVVMGHPETLDTVMHTTDGKIIEPNK